MKIFLWFAKASQLLLMLFLLISCQNNSENNMIRTKHGWKEFVVNSKGDSVMIIYNSNKQKRSEISFKNKLYDGVGYNYYLNGKVKNEIHYKKGKKNGIAKWYYKNGKLYQLTTYKNGKKNGIRKKYYKDGKLEAEMFYKDNIPQPGLKEYKEDGSPVTKYPQIHVEEINKLAFDNKYYLDVYLKPKGKKTSFYRIKNIDGEDFEIALPKGPKKGVRRIPYFLRPGEFLMEKIRIKAITTTKRGNPLVLYKTYRLSVENRFN